MIILIRNLINYSQTQLIKKRLIIYLEILNLNLLELKSQVMLVILKVKMISTEEKKPTIPKHSS